MRDDLLRLPALRLGQRQPLDRARRGADASLPGHDDQRVTLHRVLCDAPAVQGHQAEQELRLGEPLRGGAGEPSRGFRVIGPHAFTIRIGEAKKMLRDRKALVRSLAIPRDRLSRTSLKAPSIGVHESDVELGARVALLGQRGQPSDRRCVIAAVGRRNGIVEFRCRRRTGEAENQDEESDGSG